jgi:hypothetical protein
MVYRIDRNDALVYVDGAFRRFAEAAGVLDSSEDPLGQSLWSYIADDDLRAVYVALVAGARSGRTVRVTTRCESPGIAHSIEMEIARRGDGEVEFIGRLGDARLPLPASASGDGLLRLCAWCYRADLDGWRDIEEVVATEQLLERRTLPLVTHGICDACLGEAAAELDPVPA